MTINKEFIIANVISDLGVHMGTEIFKSDVDGDSVLNYFEASKNIFGKHSVHRNNTSILFSDGTSVVLEMKELIDLKDLVNVIDVVVNTNA